MSEQIERPENVCPNCWGVQEYDGKIRDAMYDQQIDINNHVKVKSFITSFVTRQIDGIVFMKDREGKYCPRCKKRA